MAMATGPTLYTANCRPKCGSVTATLLTVLICCPVGNYAELILLPTLSVTAIAASSISFSSDIILYRQSFTSTVMNNNPPNNDINNNGMRPPLGTITAVTKHASNGGNPYPKETREQVEALYDLGNANSGVGGYNALCAPAFEQLRLQKNFQTCQHARDTSIDEEHSVIHVQLGPLAINFLLKECMDKILSISPYFVLQSKKHISTK
jgi:hypothetical protein